MKYMKSSEHAHILFDRSNFLSPAIFSQDSQ